MTKGELNKKYEKTENPKSIVLYVHMPDGGVEKIKNYNVKNKMEYVNKVYNENLVHANNPEIYIIDAYFFDGDTVPLSFGNAITMCRFGERIARAGWNGKNQYVELATAISYKNSHGEIVNCNHEVIGNSALAFVGTSGVQIGWLASQADMLANDWYVVE